jgi:hypothetical protein
MKPTHNYSFLNHPFREGKWHWLPKANAQNPNECNFNTKVHSRFNFWERDFQLLPNVPFLFLLINRALGFQWGVCCMRAHFISEFFCSYAQLHGWVPTNKVSVEVKEGERASSGSLPAAWHIDHHPQPWRGPQPMVQHAELEEPWMPEHFLTWTVKPHTWMWDGISIDLVEAVVILGFCYNISWTYPSSYFFSWIKSLVSVLDTHWQLYILD